MSAAHPLSAAPAQRVAWIDRARGVALLAMIVFHASFDLSLLGYVEWNTARGGWFVFAAATAGSFIALSGVSMDLAARNGLRWRPFLRRLATIAAAAALVTAATWVAMGQPVTFGILHAIATFSVLALPFLRLPTWGIALAAAVALAMPVVATSPLFGAPLFYPLGLDPTPPPSFDYEPIFPWFAATLAGIALARVVPTPRGDPATDLLARMGRHSLAIYLLHQPLILGALLAWGWISTV